MTPSVQEIRESLRKQDAPAQAPARPSGKRMLTTIAYFGVFVASVGATAGGVILATKYWHSAPTMAHVFDTPAVAQNAAPRANDEKVVISLGGGGASELFGRLYQALLGNGTKRRDVDATASPDKDNGWFTLAFSSRPAPEAMPVPIAQPVKSSTEPDDAELEFSKTAANRLAALAAERSTGNAAPEPLVTPKIRNAAPTPAKKPAQDAQRPSPFANVERLGAAASKASKVAVVTAEEEALRITIQQARQDFRFIDAAEAAYRRFQSTLPAEALLLVYKPKMEELAAIKREAARERSTFHLVADRMRGADISDEREAQIAGCLGKIADVRAGLIARKEVAVAPNVAAYVALIDAPADFARRDKLEGDVNACLSPLSVDGTVSLLFHFNAPASRALATAMDAVPGVYVYQREGVADAGAASPG